MIDAATIKERIRATHRWLKTAKKIKREEVCEYCHDKGIVYYATDRNGGVVYLSLPGGDGKDDVTGWKIRPVVCSCRCSVAQGLLSRMDSSAYGYMTADDMTRRFGYTPMSLTAGLNARASRLLGVNIEELYDEVETEEREESKTDDDIPF